MDRNDVQELSEDEIAFLLPLLLWGPFVRQTVFKCRVPTSVTHVARMFTNYKLLAIWIVGVLALFMGQCVQGFVPVMGNRRTFAPSLCVLSSTTQKSDSTNTTSKTSKQIAQANQRIAQLDFLLDQADEKIDKLDERMQLIGDEDELFDLQKEKERIEKQIAKYLKELDDLEALLDRLHPLD